MPRSRGALSGLLLILLGVWGGLVPFIGHYFDFAYTPVNTWTWTAARGWLEVLPGAAAVLGGLFTMVSANRMTAMFGAWLGIASGAWFVVGPQLSTFANIGTPGTPTASSEGMRALESLAYFYALGAVIVFIAANALGRLSIRSVRDVRAAARRDERADALAAPATATTTATTAAPAYPDGTYAERESAHGRNDHAHRHFGLRRRHEVDANTDTTADDQHLADH